MDPLRIACLYVAAILASTSTVSNSCFADVLIQTQREGSDIRFVAEGSIDTNQLLIANAGVTPSGVISGDGFGVGHPDPIDGTAYTISTATGPLIIGTNLFHKPGSGIGDTILIDTVFGIPVVMLPDAYVANGPLYAESLYTNTSVAGLGLIPDSTYTWTFGTDIVQLNTATATPGDFNSDGEVDGADLLVWQRGGSPQPKSVDDLTSWQNHFGSGSNALQAAVAVPEPAALLLMMLSGLVVACQHDRRT